MNAKKLLALLLALVMVFALAVSCKGKTEEPTVDEPDTDVDTDTEVEEVYDGTQVPEEFVTLNFYYPGEYGARFEEYMNNEYAELMKADLNCAIEMQFAGWGDYWTKEATMLAAGEPIDFYWDGLSGIGQQVANGYVQPIDEFLEKYGYGVKKVMPEEHIATAKVKGIQYGIPGTYAPLSLAYNLSMIRTDVLEATGIENKPETPDEMTAFFTAAKDLGYKGFVSSPQEFYTRYYQYQLHPDTMLTAVGSTQLTSVVESTGEMVNRYADEAWLAAYKDIHALFVAGFIDDELLVNKSSQDPRMQSGQYTFYTGASVGKDTEIIDATRANAPEATWLVYNSVPDAPKYKALSSGEALMIPHSAQNPERVVMWWSWVYSTEEHYNATIYGVDGVDFTIDDGVLTRMTSDEFFYEWMFRIGEYMHFAGDVSQEYIDWFKSFDDDAIMSKVLGFYFDTKATDELAIAQTNIKTVLDESVLGLGMGSDDVEGDYNALLAALEDAGAQVEIDEVVRQYNEWANA